MQAFQPRLRSILRHLRGAEPLHRWKIRKSRCPNCGGGYFLSLADDAFRTRCLRCLANVTNLSLIPVIRRHTASQPVREVWEMSTYGATLNFLRASFPTVHVSEYFEGAEPGSVVDGIPHQDVQRPSFAEASLDLISSSQVFEHVPDDLLGFRECHRILRPGGALVFSVPLYDLPATERIAEQVNGRPRFHAPPEYHDSRRGGPGSALTYWHHSFHDIAQRVSSAGFETELVAIRIPPSLSEASYVVYAHKPLRTGNAAPDG